MFANLLSLKSNTFSPPSPNFYYLRFLTILLLFFLTKFQVKEFGAAVFDCPCLASDIDKIFQVYWKMGIPNTQIPSTWPRDLETNFNLANPQYVKLNDAQSLVSFSVSPPEFRPNGRDNDIDALVKVIDDAKEFVYVAVMDYAPTTLYGKPHNKYWPYIDDAFRRAAFERGVHVRLLMSRWNHTYTEFYSYLYSLQYMNASLTKGGSIEVKLFNVPDYNVTVPYARVVSPLSSSESMQRYPQKAGPVQDAVPIW